MTEDSTLIIGVDDKISPRTATAIRELDQLGFLQLSSQTMQSLNQSSLRQCPICLDNTDEKDQIVLECGHIGHRQCVVDMVRTALSDRQIPDCRLAPDCKIEIADWILDELLTPEQIEEHHKNLLERSMPDIECFWCPSKCGAIISFEDPSKVTRFECPDCKKVFCLKCQCEWHKNSTCELYKQWCEENKHSSSLFFKYLKSHDVKKCPKCGVNVEKNRGCDHMTCTRCRYEWFWSSGKPYHSGPHPPVAHQVPRLTFDASAIVPPTYVSSPVVSPVVSPVISSREEKISSASHIPHLMEGTPRSRGAIVVRLNYLYGLLSKTEKADWVASILEESQGDDNRDDDTQARGGLRGPRDVTDERKYPDSSVDRMNDLFKDI